MGKHKDGSGIICIICRGVGHLLDGWCKTCGGDGHIQQPEVVGERAGKSEEKSTIPISAASTYRPAKPTAKHYLPRSERYSAPPPAHQRTI